MKMLMNKKFKLIRIFVYTLVIPLFLSGTFKTAYADEKEFSLQAVNTAADNKTAASNKSPNSYLKKAIEDYTFGKNFKENKKHKKFVIAILDTGVAVDKLSILRNIDFIKGYNFCGSEEKGYDDNGHGTFITSWLVDTISSLDKNISYSIMPLKILDCDKKGNSRLISWGIRYAVLNGAKVINISCGAKKPLKELEEAVKFAYENNVIVVASAGNYGEKNLLYPASYDSYAISVGAVDSNGKRANYSNYGESLFITAPGGDLNKPVYALGFNKETPEIFCTLGKEGTSVSAAYITAFVAYLVSEGYDTPDKVKKMLIQSSIDLGPKGKDKYYGWGLINPKKILETVYKEKLKQKN